MLGVSGLMLFVDALYCLGNCFPPKHLHHRCEIAGRNQFAFNHYDLRTIRERKSAHFVRQSHLLTMSANSFTNIEIKSPRQGSTRRRNSFFHICGSGHSYPDNSNSVYKTCTQAHRQRSYISGALNKKDSNELLANHLALHPKDWLTTKYLLQNFRDMFSVSQSWIEELSECLSNRSTPVALFFVDLDNVPRFFKHITRNAILDVLPFESFIVCSGRSSRNESWKSSKKIHFSRAHITKDAADAVCTMAAAKLDSILVGFGRQDDTPLVIVSDDRIFSQVAALLEQGGSTPRTIGKEDVNTSMRLLTTMLTSTNFVVDGWPCKEDGRNTSAGASAAANVSTQALINHIAADTAADSRWQCEQCSRAFYSAESLMRHQLAKLHKFSGSRPSGLPVNTSSTSDPSSADAVTGGSLDGSKASKRPSSKSRLYCGHCNRTFKSKISLEAHCRDTGHDFATSRPKPSSLPPNARAVVAVPAAGNKANKTLAKSPTSRPWSCPKCNRTHARTLVCENARTHRNARTNNTHSPTFKREAPLNQHGEDTGHHVPDVKQSESGRTDGGNVAITASAGSITHSARSATDIPSSRVATAHSRWKCQNCGRAFDSEESLKQHRRATGHSATDTPEKSTPASRMSSLKSQTTTSLAKAVAQKSSKGNTTKVESSKDRRRWHCEHCNRTLNSESKLRAHCRDTGHSFPDSRLSAVKVALQSGKPLVDKVSAGQKAEPTLSSQTDWSCKGCGRVFKTKSSLLQHCDSTGHGLPSLKQRSVVKGISSLIGSKSRLSPAPAAAKAPSVRTTVNTATQSHCVCEQCNRPFHSKRSLNQHRIATSHRATSSLKSKIHYNGVLSSR